MGLTSARVRHNLLRRYLVPVQCTFEGSYRLTFAIKCGTNFYSSYMYLPLSSNLFFIFFSRVLLLLDLSLFLFVEVDKPVLGRTARWAHKVITVKLELPARSWEQSVTAVRALIGVNFGFSRLAYTSW